MLGSQDRASAVLALLRQLWLGFASYRLYPERSERPGFAGAVDRIGAAVGRALALGGLEVTVRGDRFLLDGEPLAADPSTQRLAVACFERGVERHAILAVPSAEDLSAMYRVLSGGAEGDEAGDPGEALRRLGVTSVVLSRGAPAPVEGATHVLVSGEPTGAETPLLPELMMLEDLPGSPRQQAETLLARMGETLAAREGTIRPIDLHAALHAAVTELPSDLRRSLVDLALERFRDDPAAERLIGTMSDPDLARALVDLGRTGRHDPVRLARELVAAGVRRAEVVDLVGALATGHEEAGAIVAGLERLGIDLTGGNREPDVPSATEALAAYLTATEGEDAREVASLMTLLPEEERSHALLALRDYLALEADAERVGEVLDVWAGEMHAALRARDARRVRALLRPVREVLVAPGREEAGSLFGEYARRALDPSVVSALVEEAAEREGAGSVSELLEPFGDLGVEVLLDLLAEEEDRERRAKLLAVLRRIARGHLAPVIARLSDPRWYVARNAVALLGHAGGEEALPRLVEAARHASAEVRKEATSAIVIAGGPSAVPVLRRLADEGTPDVRRFAVTGLSALRGTAAAEALADVVRSGHDPAVRQVALEQLARHPEGAEALRGLASRRGRLPWRVRRRARSLLRARARGSG